MILAKKFLFLVLLSVNTQLSFGFEKIQSIFKETKESSKIMALSVSVAIAYGIINDQVTARICPEYFTEGFHRRMIERRPNGLIKEILLTTKSPTVLAFVWGTIATWWMGALLGIPVTASARLGNLPKLNSNDLVKPATVGLISMFASSFFAGLKGYSYAKKQTPEDLKNLYFMSAAGVPPEAMRGWVTDAYAHLAAYASGILMGLGLTAYNIAKRISLKQIK